MTSTEALKTKLKPDEFFHNTSPTGKRPNWIICRHSVCSLHHDIQTGTNQAMCFRCYEKGGTK
jgi:uncharacterized paraquat-inducible protein A